MWRFVIYIDIGWKSWFAWVDKVMMSIFKNLIHVVRGFKSIPDHMFLFVYQIDKD